MARKEHKRTAKVISGVLYTNDESTNGATVGTQAWFTWLEAAHSFYYEGQAGAFTAVKERRKRGGEYWTAYRRASKTLRRFYLGKTGTLTAQRLIDAAAGLAK